MSIVANRTRLEASTRELLNRWKETKEYWTDAKSVEFERKYIEEIIVGVNTAVSAIEEMEKLMLKIRSDCE